MDPFLDEDDEGDAGDKGEVIGLMFGGGEEAVVGMNSGAMKRDFTPEITDVDVEVGEEELDRVLLV